jgi:hypothetical protein
MLLVLTGRAGHLYLRAIIILNSRGMLYISTCLLGLRQCVEAVETLNMLTGNHYFSPDIKPEVITHYCRHLENTLDTNNTRVILLGDFNAPGFNWESGTPLPNSHYYSKLKGDAIHTSTCLLGLRQCVEAVDTLNMLDLVFANFTDLKSVPADSGLVAPDKYHPPLNITESGTLLS